MVFYEAPLNTCSRCCPFLPHKVNTVCLNPFLEYKCVFICQKVHFTMQAPLSRASHPSLAATSLPREWTLLWLPEWTPSHLLAGPKNQASHTGSHNPDTIVVGTLEIYEYLKVAIILFLSLYPLCLEKTQGKWIKAFRNTGGNRFPVWNTWTVACLIFSGFQGFFLRKYWAPPVFKSDFSEDFSNWLSRHTNHFFEHLGCETQAACSFSI